MKVLCVRGGRLTPYEPVAILEEADLNNTELLKKLEGLEREYSKAGAFVSKMGMFEIVELDNNDIESANQALGGRLTLANGLDEYVKKFEKKVKNYIWKQCQSRTSYYDEYANQAAFDNGYPD